MIRDGRYGLRLLRRAPVFATVAILSLTLGRGANAAILQLIDTVRLRNLPIANPQELAEVRADGVHGFGVSGDFNSEVTYPLGEQIRTHQAAFARMFAWGTTTRAQIVMLVLGDSRRLLGMGLAIGLPLAAATLRGAGASLYGLSPIDVPTVAGATCLLATAASLAGFVPAWRAARVSPDIALRCD